MNSSRIWLLLSVLFFFSPTLSWAQDFCRSTTTAKGCFEKYSLKISACEMEWSANDCDQFAKDNPEAKADGKLLDCKKPSTCGLEADFGDHLSMCKKAFKESWIDMSKGVWAFLSGEASAPSVETLQKLDYFKKCDAIGAECKREMLGSFASYFSDKEIAGVSGEEGKGLNPDLPENQNKLHGYSSAVLYRKLLLQLKKEMDQGRSMDEKFINPWSGEEAQLPSSINEMIDQTLSKAGLKNSACYRSEVVTEMRCYALFSILDPTVAVGAIAKISRVAGLVRKTQSLVGNGLKNTRVRLENANILKSHDGNPVVKVEGPLAASRSRRGIIWEDSVVKKGKNVKLNEVIDALEKEGGQVRSLSRMDLSIVSTATEQMDSYFRFDQATGAPILALEKGASPAIIAHEMQHFNDWPELKNDFVKKGFTEQEARLKAHKQMSTMNGRSATESNAVDVELSTLKASVMDTQYMARKAYPKLGSILHETQQSELAKRPISSKMQRQMNRMMDEAIEDAIRIRQTRGVLLQRNLNIENDPVMRQRIQADIDANQDLSTLGREMNMYPSLQGLFDSRLQRALGN